MTRCARTNQRYMQETPAGEAGFTRVRNLYQRIADESVGLAEDRAAGWHAPKHMPAVDAFWWSVVRWAWSFGLDLDLGEDWYQTFVKPHQEFAHYLKQRNGDFIGDRSRHMPHHHGATPAELTLLHDADWTMDAIRLTARWGMLRHIRDIPAIVDSWRLVRRLRRWPDPVAFKYAHGDLIFFRELFGHFEFEPATRAILDGYMADLQTQLEVKV